MDIEVEIKLLKELKEKLPEDKQPRADELFKILDNLLFFNEDATAKDIVFAFLPVVFLSCMKQIQDYFIMNLPTGEAVRFIYGEALKTKD